MGHPHSRLPRIGSKRPLRFYPSLSVAKDFQKSHRRLRFEALEDRHLLAGAPGTIDEFGAAQGVPLASAANGIAYQFGRMWFTEQSQPGIGGASNSIGQIVTDGSETAATEIPIHDTSGNAVSNAFANGIAIGPHGSVWFAEGRGDVTKYDPGTGNFTDYAISGGHPTSVAAVFNQDLLDFVMYFTDQGNNTIGRILPNGTIDPHPSTIPTDGAHPFDITEGPDGNAWFTELFGNKIGRVNSDGSITEFPLPHADSSPEGITAGPDGSLWFTEQNRATIGRITPAGQIQEYPFFGTIDQPAAIATGLNGNLWFTESTTDPNTQAAIGRIWEINARTGQLRGPYLIPTAGTVPGDIALGSDLNVWFTESKFNFDPMNPFGGTYTGHIGRLNVPDNTLAPVDVGFRNIEATPSPAKIGQPVTFTITVQNNTADTAKNVIVYDPIPADVTAGSVTSSQGTSTQINGQIAIDLGDLAGNASATIHVTVTPTAAGSITNRAYVVTDSPDGNGSNNSAEKTITAELPVTSLSLSGVLLGDASGSPMVIDANSGDVITAGIFGWKLTNTGDTTITGASISIPLAGQPLTHIVPDAYISNIFSPVGNARYDAPTNSIIVTGLPDLPPHGTPLKFGFAADPAGVGVVHVTANVSVNQQLTGTSPPSNTISYQVNTTIESPTAALSLSGAMTSIPANSSGSAGEAPAASAPISGTVNVMTIDATSGNVDNSGKFDWLIINNSAVTATGVVVDVTIPLGSSGKPILKNINPYSDGSFSPPTAAGHITFTLPYVTSKHSANFGFYADPTQIGPVSITATVRANEPLTGGGSLQQTIDTVVLSSLTNQLANPWGYDPFFPGGVLGTVIPNPDIVPIYYGSQWKTNADGSPAAANLLAFPAQMHAAMQSIVSGPYMDFLSQYSTLYQKIGRGTVEADNFRTDVTAPIGATDTLDDTISPDSGSPIKNIVLNQLQSYYNSTGKFPDHVNSLYVIFAPPNTEVDRGTETSRRFGGKFLAYHGAESVQLLIDGQQVTYPFWYIVMPYQDGAFNGKAPPKKFLDDMTVTFSHELAEAVTDPDVITGWRDYNDPQQPEIGDIETWHALETPSEGSISAYGMLDGYAVQYEFANIYTYPRTDFTVFDQPVLPQDGTAPTVQIKKIVNPFNRTITTVPGGSGEASYSFSGLIASFDDATNAAADPSIYSATIDWGDGTTSDGVVTYDTNLKQFLISGSHTFASAAGSTATINISLLNNSSGAVAALTSDVTLQETSTDAATVQFDQPSIDAYRNGSDATIIIDRVGDTSLDATVDYHISGGTAIDGIDYQAISGTVTFAPGATTATILLPVYSNPAATGDLTVNLMLSTPTGNTVLGSLATTTVTIHPSDQIFTPPAAVLDAKSDTGPYLSDAVTSNNGSAAAPLVFKITGASITGGFAQLVDVTDPNDPVLLGAPLQLTNGAASATITDASLADGTHQIAYINSVSPGSTPSRASQTTQITIDSVAPTSHIVTLPARTSLTSLDVSWSGADNTGGSGIRAYNISVSIDGAPATSWLTATDLTSSTYAATLGHSYAFFASAIDVAGNSEVAHPLADATVVVTATPWQNNRSRLDVNNDTHIAANDALAVINYINAFGAIRLPASAPVGQSFLDVNGDNNVAPNDALDVINAINAGQASEGEGPQPDATTNFDDVLNLLALDSVILSPRRHR